MAAERARMETERERVARAERQLSRNRVRVSAVLRGFDMHLTKAVAVASLEGQLKVAAGALARAKELYDKVRDEPMYRAARTSFLRAEAEHARLVGEVGVAREVAHLARRGSREAADNLVDYLGTNRAARELTDNLVGVNADPALNPVDLSCSPKSASDEGDSSARIKRRGDRGLGSRRGGKRSRRDRHP